MSIGEALIYSLLGISVVFFALILLMIMIKVLVALTGKKAQAAPAPQPAAVAPAPAPKAPEAPGTAGDLKLYDTDPRTAAMIMAIVADKLHKPLNELRFISIKEIKD